ncbi:hypothetical protein O181_083992 [Austropuccinia psidii MF-1]|uniref:Reverse transcriptase RNase H-like domain-containing protein n=1 Tax=Austropuccinia psidii MF-1 TaxID=1389203 RepID=A0A9Q3FVF5_9BASI|nr:hypothetical protein [Austropuccinia psidii MF-1]
MDLPPSSYYDSLEDLWDEEEETMMMVVSSVYRQYLDAFSKVKAAELPPHRGCDHCIKLEGSLPPAGVIYSLSNHESDTLRDYISENIDASNYALDAVLSQVSDSGKNLIVFNSCKLIPAELNYAINKKELLGIVWAFLLSLSSPFEVLTNHSSLQYFMSSKVLTRRQARCPEFHFTITYCPGGLATLPDALSCQESVYPERGEDFISKNTMNSQQLIKQDEVQPSRYFAVKV